MSPFASLGLLARYCVIWQSLRAQLILFPVVNATTENSRRCGFPSLYDFSNVHFWDCRVLVCCRTSSRAKETVHRTLSISIVCQLMFDPPGHRGDALGFLEALMGSAARLVVEGFLQPALQHFLDLLSAGSRGRSVSAGSMASLQKVGLKKGHRLRVAFTLGGSGWLGS